MKQTEHEEIKLQLEGMLFTWDDEKDIIRIISARKTTKEERRRYVNGDR